MCDVSVIIPIFNGEKYLKTCLDSVCNQSLSDIEIICIDDGSTDNTLKILKKYQSKDKRLKIISTENHGQGHARNIALSKVKGEYVSFVDVDDWIEEDALELLYYKAKNDNLDMLFFQMMNYIENSGKFIETDLYNFQCFEENGITENTIFNHNDTKGFLFEIPVGPVSKLYKKEFLDINSLKFPEGIFFEDNSFFYNAYFKCNSAGFVKKHLYYRRRHDNSVTQTFDETKFDIIVATNNMIDVFFENEKYYLYKKSLINHTFSMLIEWFKKSPLNLKQKFYRLIKRDFKGVNELKNDFENNLKKNYLLIYDLMINYEHYLDFLSIYKLNIVDYVIFDKNKEFEWGTEEYAEYKSNLSKNYKISVIIPIFNNEKFIHRTLMSIENQTLGVESIEVLMVDDSSNDNTYQVLKNYSVKHEGFKAIHIKKGTGSPGTPRNVGLLESSAPYVIFLDHDDLFEVNGLEVLYDSIIESNSDFVYGTYVSIDLDKPTKIIFPNEKHGCFKSISENERAIAFPPPSIWTKLFKRDFLIKNCILFPTILGEDAIFLSNALIKANKICYLWDSIICYHVLNKKSYTNSLTYNYLLEGFTSEDYMYNLYNKINPTLYKIRGEGILDFYLTQFYKTNLSKTELIEIFPILFNFVERINLLGLTPHVTETNVILFNHILNRDIESIMDIKRIEYKTSRIKNLKNILKKIKKNILR